jgi:2-haloacid dehalogenase
MAKKVVAFDLYGTLLSTASVSKALAAHFGEEKANSIATVWRKYQLEYTWRLNSMGMNLVLLRLPPNSLQNSINASPKSLGAHYSTH